MPVHGCLFSILSKKPGQVLVGERDIHPPGVERSFHGPRWGNLGLFAMQKGTGGRKPLVAALSSLMPLSFYLKKPKPSSFNLIKQSAF